MEVAQSYSTSNIPGKKTDTDVGEEFLANVEQNEGAKLLMAWTATIRMDGDELDKLVYTVNKTLRECYDAFVEERKNHPAKYNATSAQQNRGTLSNAVFDWAVEWISNKVTQGMHQEVVLEAFQDHKAYMCPPSLDKANTLYGQAVGSKDVEYEDPLAQNYMLRLHTLTKLLGSPLHVISRYNKGSDDKHDCCLSSSQAFSQASMTASVEVKKAATGSAEKELVGQLLRRIRSVQKDQGGRKRFTFLGFLKNRLLVLHQTETERRIYIQPHVCSWTVGSDKGGLKLLLCLLNWTHAEHGGIPSTIAWNSLIVEEKTGDYDLSNEGKITVVPKAYRDNKQIVWRVERSDPNTQYVIAVKAFPKGADHRDHEYTTLTELAKADVKHVVRPVFKGTMEVDGSEVPVLGIFPIGERITRELEEHVILGCLRDVHRALYASFNAKVLHGDVSPHNMIQYDGADGTEGYLIDFDASLIAGNSGGLSGKWPYFSRKLHSCMLQQRRSNEVTTEEQEIEDDWESLFYCMLHFARDSERLPWEGSVGKHYSCSDMYAMKCALFCREQSYFEYKLHHVSPLFRKCLTEMRDFVLDRAISSTENESVEEKIKQRYDKLDYMFCQWLGEAQ
eukprot:gb/GECG01000772.1/.p1 GENE.gb/GECG01000772.1/~~gb/GECG01000772.1/.p1  ORF type:complete len:619 (+),score=66.37 gb/GECG01000772.1/:1-1857(+)